MLKTYLEPEDSKLIQRTILRNNIYKHCRKKVGIKLLCRKVLEQTDWLSLEICFRRLAHGWHPGTWISGSSHHSQTWSKLFTVPKLCIKCGLCWTLGNPEFWYMPSREYLHDQPSALNLTSFLGGQNFTCCYKNSLFFKLNSTFCWLHWEDSWKHAPNFPRFHSSHVPFSFANLAMCPFHCNK